MGDRCTGDCCRSYTLPFEPDDLQALASEHLASVFTGVPPQNEFTDSVSGIAMMSIPIGEFTADPSGEAQPNHIRYRCRNLLDNGNCRIYESRPGMCQRYPYECGSGVCEFPGCTWDEKRPENVKPLVNGKLPLYSEVLDGS